MRWNNFSFWTLIVGLGVLAVYLAMRHDDRRNQRRIWIGWTKCPGCRGLFPEATANECGFCSNECQEISELERLSQI